MTQVYTGTLTSLAWKHSDVDYAVRNPYGPQLLINHADFERDFIPLGHIDHLPPHQQRMIAERAQIQDRLTKLKAFTETDLYQSLEGAEKADLGYQAQLMRDLVGILDRRIERFSGKAFAQPISSR